MLLIIHLFVALLIPIKSNSYQNTWHHHQSDHLYKIPQDVMVEVVNNLAMKLLVVHNEGNDNNIAISPYGALSVLVALGEGTRGEAVYEILEATGIPPDLTTLRIGLRDIHRHLKSYFIPEEGFLSGLTLSHDNVTLRREYEDILRFYGYDLNSFNNAQYPNVLTTPKPEEPVSNKEGEGDSMEMTSTTTESERPIRSEATTSTTMDLSTVPITTTKITTLAPTTISSTTRSEEISTMPTTLIPTTTTQTPTTPVPITTTASLLQEDEEKTATSSDLPTTTQLTSRQITETTTEVVREEASTTVKPIVLPETTTVSVVEATSTMEATTVEEMSTSAEKSETVTETEELSTLPTTTDSQITDNLVERLDDSSTSPMDDATTFYPATDSIETTVFDSTTEEASTESRSGRSSRSVLDYVIARYYDDHSITQRPPPAYHNPTNDFNFLINGNYKESDINYMTYDTILPFHYIGHLKTLALRFPLDSAKYYLLLLLPEDPNGINRLICDLQPYNSLKSIIDNLRYTHVKALIPSFMLKGYVILTSTLQKMGIRKVFEPRLADFSPMTSDGRIYVTNIEQAITVTIRNYVDPNTMNVNYRYLHQDNPVVFKADHPFLYFVIDSEINVALMAGKIINPLNSRIR